MTGILTCFFKMFHLIWWSGIIYLEYLKFDWNKIELNPLAVVLHIMNNRNTINSWFRVMLGPKKHIPLFLCHNPGYWGLFGRRLHLNRQLFLLLLISGNAVWVVKQKNPRTKITTLYLSKRLIIYARRRWFSSIKTTNFHCNNSIISINSTCFFFAELFILPNIRQTIIFRFHQNRFDPAQLLASRIHPLMQFYLKYSASHLEGSSSST